MPESLVRKTIFAVILSFVAGIAGVWLGLKTLPASDPSPINLHEIVHHEFDLNAEQEAALNRLEAEYAHRREKYIEALKAANFEMAAAIKKHHDLSPEVVLAEQKYLSVLGEFQTETLRHIFAMRAIMSPGQAKKFDDIVLRSLHDIAQ
ncbi:MAG: heavy metal resistance protein [Robiginitomaculum sp.]|nr:MAG: heavy metal resistance protein [Robiginitomaculum sp.]